MHSLKWAKRLGLPASVWKAVSGEGTGTPVRTRSASGEVKRCGTCSRIYADATLKFCFDDGTPLTGEPYDSLGSMSRTIENSRTISDLEQTRIFGTDSASGDLNVEETDQR